MEEVVRRTRCIGAVQTNATELDLQITAEG
jgi:hypothetical protein